MDNGSIYLKTYDLFNSFFYELFLEVVNVNDSSVVFSLHFADFIIKKRSQGLRKK